MDTTTAHTACPCCHRVLRDGETLACRICREQGTGWLRALPGLYAASASYLAPGRSASGTGRVSGSKSAPLPARCDVLDARGPGGVVWVVTQWEEVVRSELGFGEVPFRGDYERSLVGSVEFLVANAAWLYGHFGAVQELHDEIRACYLRLDGLVNSTNRERSVNVSCECGNVLRGVTLSTPGRRCRSCGKSHTWSELLKLELADRAAA